MELKFIGTDGSMGLEHGKVYDVNIQSKKGFIWVEVKNGIFKKWKCPYESPQSLSANWCLP